MERSAIVPGKGLGGEFMTELRRVAGEPYSGGILREDNRGHKAIREMLDQAPAPLIGPCDQEQNRLSAGNDCSNFIWRYPRLVGAGRAGDIEHTSAD
jgi:hypothetical protein